MTPGFIIGNYRAIRKLEFHKLKTKISVWLFECISCHTTREATISDIKTCCHSNHTCINCIKLRYKPGNVINNFKILNESTNEHTVQCMTCDHIITYKGNHTRIHKKTCTFCRFGRTLSLSKIALLLKSKLGYCSKERVRQVLIKYPNLTEYDLLDMDPLILRYKYMLSNKNNIPACLRYAVQSQDIPDYISSKCNAMVRNINKGIHPLGIKYTKKRNNQYKKEETIGILRDIYKSIATL